MLAQHHRPVWNENIKVEENKTEETLFLSLFFKNRKEPGTRGGGWDVGKLEGVDRVSRQKQ